MDIEIIWFDENLLAINKPSGLRTIPDGYHPELPCAVELLQREYGPLWVVHRLDKETSGVLLFARNASMHKYLNNQFQNRLIQKIYHALIIGEPDWEDLTIRFPLKVDGDRQHRTRTNLPGSKPAETVVKVVSRFSGYSFVEVRPLTGYTHQIRAHLSAEGFPIVSDSLYDRNFKAHSIIISRLALHAYQISFIYAESINPMLLSAPDPIEFSEAIVKIRALKS